MDNWKLVKVSKTKPYDIIFFNKRIHTIETFTLDKCLVVELPIHMVELYNDMDSFILSPLYDTSTGGMCNLHIQDNGYVLVKMYSARKNSFNI